MDVQCTLTYYQPAGAFQKTSALPSPISSIYVNLISSRFCVRNLFLFPRARALTYSVILNAFLLLAGLRGLFKIGELEEIFESAELLLKNVTSTREEKSSGGWIFPPLVRFRGFGFRELSIFSQNSKCIVLNTLLNFPLHPLQ